MKILNKLFSIENVGLKVVIRIFGLRLTFKPKSRLLKQKDIEVNRYYNLLNIMSTPADAPRAIGKLREDQEKNLELLKQVKEVLDASKIPYWVEFGTLLGALRHKGFIPWDTDTDLAAVREDIYKVVPALREKFKNTRFEVREKDKTAHYQIRIKDKEDNNVGVDIFPLDKYPKENLTEEEKEQISLRIIKAQKLFNRKYKNTKEAVGDINKIREDIEKMTDEIICCGNKNYTEQSSMFFALDFPLLEGVLIRNYDDIFPLKEIEFEGIKFPCPNKSEKHLAYYYGKNIMKFPRLLFPMDRMDEYIENILNSK